VLLQGKTALITGAGRGIGRAITLAFAKEGCDVAVIARTQEQIDATAQAVRDLGRKGVAIPCDVANHDDVVRAVTTTVNALGKIDVLVNNAGCACFKPFEELEIDEWRRTLDVNLTAVFLFVRAVLPVMKAQRAGRIINVSSVAGVKPIANQSAYCASKYGLNGLTRVLAMELRPYGIGVHAICPGGVDTELSRQAMPERDKTNWLLPEDIAQTALYLAALSPRAAVDEIVVRRFGSDPL